MRAPELVLPTSDAAYYLSISGLPSITANNTSRSLAGRMVTISVNASGGGSPLLTACTAGVDEDGWGRPERDVSISNDLTIDKRFHFVPAAHLLVTIPPENDRLVLRTGNFDVDAALNRDGGDALIVTSPSRLLARAGQSFEHRVVARSRKGGLAFALATGPDGLDVATDGTLTWSVPKRLPSDEVRAVVTARDATGQEVLQALTIHVKGAEVPPRHTTAGAWRRGPAERRDACSCWAGRSRSPVFRSAPAKVDPARRASRFRPLG